MKSFNKCLVCKEDAPYTGFCKCCNAAKEAAYAESRILGETNYVDVISRREEFLIAHYKKVHEKH